MILILYFLRIIIMFRQNVGYKMLFVTKGRFIFIHLEVHFLCKVFMFTKLSFYRQIRNLCCKFYYFCSNEGGLLSEIGVDYKMGIDFKVC